MAVQYSNNAFDWCRQLVEVKINYNAEECLAIAKKKLQSLLGLDEKFVKDVCAKSLQEVKISLKYVPVYDVSVKLSANWSDTKSDTEMINGRTYDVLTTTNHSQKRSTSKEFFKGIHKDLKVNAYVGRADSRFYKLAHVDDLKGGILSPEKTVYGRAELYKVIEKNANYLLGRGETKVTFVKGKAQVNQWSATVFFVPIAVISFTYGGKEYTSLVNMHNGQSRVEYKLQEKLEVKAKNAWLISKILLVLGVLFTGLTIVLGGDSALVLIIAIICMIIGFKKKKEFFKDFYAISGSRTNLKLLFKAYRSETVSCLIILFSVLYLFLLI